MADVEDDTQQQPRSAEETDSVAEMAEAYARRRTPPAERNCVAEKMVTIEAVSLRRGGWRNTEGFLNDLRHLDPNIGVLIFYGVITAMLFYLFWKTTKSMSIAAMYTTSGLSIIALTFGALFGIDFFAAIGASVFPL